MENWVSLARFPGKSPCGWVYFVLKPCRSKLKGLKVFLRGEIWGWDSPSFSSVFSGVYSLRVLLFLRQGGPNSLPLSPHWLCSPVSPRELLALGEIKSPRLGLQRGEVGGEIRSGDFQAAREGRACKEKPGWEEPGGFCGKSSRGRAFPCGGFPARSLHWCPLAEGRAI